MRCNKCLLRGKCQAMRARAKRHFAWTVHNIIGHPVSELLHLIGLPKLGERIHNLTIPEGKVGGGK